MTVVPACRGEAMPNVLEQVARARERSLQQYSLRKSGAKQPVAPGVPGARSAGRSDDSLTASVSLSTSTGRSSSGSTFGMAHHVCAPCNMWCCAPRLCGLSAGLHEACLEGSS